MKQYSVTPLAILGVILWSHATVAQDDMKPEDLYQENCALCHGEDLRGGNAQSMLDGLWQFGEGEGSIFENIRYGITHVGMPAFEGILTEDQIDGLANYLIELEEKSGIEKPPPPERIQTLEYEIKVDIWADGLEIPWAIDFLDENSAPITERPGRLRVVRDGKLLLDPVADIPSVLHQGQGGLMDVAVDPAYTDNGWIYLAYSHALDESEGEERAPAMTRIVRGRLKDNAWVDEQVVFEAAHGHYIETRYHYGCCIVFDPQGHLYFSIGERGFQEHAQDPGRPNGKVHRIHPDGTIPKDNPFVGKEDALPTVFTYGNRNAQGLAVHPETGRVWETEHGPMGGDEVNLLSAGRNYGWPEITYGRDYDGSLVSKFTRKPGMEQPILYWRPSVGVAGMDFYRGD